MAKGKDNRTMIDRLPGDKVVWIIVSMLCIISLVSIFSSTSQLAAQDGVSRVKIAKDQFLTIAGGLVLILGCCLVSQINLFRRLSKWGFLLSLLLLVPLVMEINLPFIKAVSKNGAFRWLRIFGISFSVFEIVKVAMVMYLAWAIEHLKTDRIEWLENLKHSKNLSWLSKPLWRDFIYLFIPTIIVSVLTLKGSSSTALMTAGCLFLTMLLGRVNFAHIMVMGLLALAVFSACFGLYSVSKGSEHVLFERIGTAVSRSKFGSSYYIQEVENSQKKDQHYYDCLDKIRQPYGAKIAIKEGGLFGKGPGQSTQKYKVSVMYEDYMFSFLVEEYGLVMAIFVIILYLSLLARGSIIIKNCKGDFAKIAVAGLCVLISGQAMFHIVVNCDVGILTGQTLPMISHGRTSFLAFCIAFGIILSISRMAEKRIAEETKQEASLLVVSEDNVRSSMDALDAAESADMKINDDIEDI